MRCQKLIPLLAAAMLLCACNEKGSSSETIEDMMSQANEINYMEEDPCACLPDTVSLDDEKHTHELEPDNGVITLDRMGVSMKLPDGYNAYLFEQDDTANYYKEMAKDPDKAKDLEKPADPNQTCDAALFLVNGNFPYSHEFIRVGYYTSIFAEYQPMQWFEENTDYRAIKTKTDYKKLLQSDLDKLSDAFIANEGLDAYDYTHLDSAHKEWLELGHNSNDTATIPDILWVSPVDNIFRAPADDSSVGEIKCEQVELESGYIGLKLTYELKRHGVEMDKEVYWLLDLDAQEEFSVMRRVEFSKDKGAVWGVSPETFLKDFKITPPDYADPGYPIDYFGVNNLTFVQ